MATSVSISYSAASGAGIHAGRYPGGHVSGAFVLDQTLPGGGLSVGALSSLTGAVQLSDVSPAGGLTSGAEAETQRYRFQHPLLFQRAHAQYEPASYINSFGHTVYLPGEERYFGVAYPGPAQRCGTTRGELCVVSMWKWQNEGGDWIDATLTPQGSTAWATTPLLPVTSTPGEVVLDVTAAIQRCDSTDRWYALMLQVVSSGQVSIVGPVNPPEVSRSVLEVVRGGVASTKELWYAASMPSTSGYLDAQDPTVILKSSAKVVLEFPRTLSEQGTPVTSATLRLRYEQVAQAATIKVFVVNPQVPDVSTPVPGIAAAYPLDVGLFGHSAVAARIHVLDTDALPDLVDYSRTGGATNPWDDGTPNLSVRTEADWDPAMWVIAGDPAFSGAPTYTTEQLADKMPRAAISSSVTKLVGLVGTEDESIRVVTGAQLTTLGLPVLASGLGALEMKYANTGILPGQSSSEGTTTGGALGGGIQPNDFSAFFKPAHIGQVIDGYMRMHVMLGDGWDADDSLMRWNWATGSTTTGRWPEEDPSNFAVSSGWNVNSFSGKFPGGLQHVTSHYPVNSYVYPTRQDTLGATDSTPTITETSGGYSASSGVYAYQGRWSMYQGFYKENHPGPAIGGMRLAMETYDFSRNPNCIPSQASIGGWESTWKASPHIGGLGHLYPRKWYCVEMRWKMNTITLPYAEPAVGTHFLESGFNVDGFIEWWIDGIYAGQSPLFAHRSSRMVDWILQNSEGLPVGTADRFRAFTGVPADKYMGAIEAVMQTYFGGRAPCPQDMLVYVNGVVVSNGAYIGPMKGVSRDNGGIP